MPRQIFQEEAGAAFFIQSRIWLRREWKLQRRFPAEDMERIWQSFYKSGRGNYKKDLKLSNAGLGLYMVKKIVEQHGGRCGAENEENGVTFWMEFAAHQKSVANNRSFGKQHA